MASHAPRLYARLRADRSQVLDLQRDALLAAGVAEHLYEDFASGKRDDRPGLAGCLKALRAGDTLLVWKLDRLGHNLHHLVTTVHDLTARGVGLARADGVGGADRHHHSRRQAHLRYLRGAGRVRARTDRRAHTRRAGGRGRAGATAGGLTR
jgi:DNA invertase Pin-like site-specific DNA recombinase